MKHFSWKPLWPSTQTQRRIRFWVQTLSFMVSVVVLGALFIDYGYTLKPHETEYVHAIYHFGKLFYLILFSATLLLQMRRLRRKAILMTLITGLALYSLMLPHWFPLSSAESPLRGLWHLFENTYYVGAILGLFATMELSRAVVNFINKRTNPALMLAAGFAVIIVLGTLLLLVPRSTLPHIHLSVVDALFVATSSVCVTGLSPVELATTFTLEGQTVILLLIQIGGLGVMTITSFFALFFMGNTGLYNQFALRDMLSSETFSSLVSALLYILGFTFVIELCGAALIWHSIHGTLGYSLHEELYFSLFHAVSAFCNAGFSTLEGNLGNEAILTAHNGFYLWISLLIVLGGIGFPILVNFKDILFYHLRMAAYRLLGVGQKPIRYRHLTNINTKIVLFITALLLVGGTLWVGCLEWNGAFHGMTTGEKLTQSLFNAVAPRTAGFNSVDLREFSFMTLLGYLFLMWVGGGSQSTAGGLKVNTLGVAWANFLSVIRGRERVTLFGREIPAESVRRASATIFASMCAILTAFVLLVAIEPAIHPTRLLFETISALSTVGSSLGVTPELGEAGKLILTGLMFMGRVGLITVLMSLLPARPDPKYRLPKDNVIIN